MPRYECASEEAVALATILIDDCSELHHLKAYHLRFFMVEEWKGKKEWLYGEVKPVTNITALLMRGQLKPGMASEDPADWPTYAVFLNKRMWNALKTDEQRRMVLYPYLYSLQVKDSGEGLAVEDADITLFKKQVARFGCELPDVRKILEMIEKGAQGELPLDNPGDGNEGEEESSGTGVHRTDADVADSFFSVISDVIRENIEKTAPGDDFAPDSDEEHDAMMERRRKIEYGATDEDIARARTGEGGDQ